MNICIIYMFIFRKQVYPQRELNGFPQKDRWGGRSVSWPELRARAPPLPVTLVGLWNVLAVFLIVTKLSVVLRSQNLGSEMKQT